MKETPPQNNAIESVLRTQRKGAMLTEASEALQKLTLAVKEHCKTGKLTIEITLTPMGDGSAVTVLDDIRLKLPKAPVKGSIFYTTDEGTLHREDPNQQEMDLKVVAPIKAETVPLQQAVS